MSKLYDLLSAVIAKIAKVAADTPAIDDTLTVKGAAADAKAVGDAVDRVSELKVNVSKIDKTFDCTFDEILSHYKSGGSVTVYAYWSWAPNEKTIYLPNYIGDTKAEFAVSTVYNPYSDKVRVKTEFCHITPDNVVTLSSKEFYCDGNIEPGNSLPVEGSKIYGYAVPIPETAEVGQTIAVKAVNEYGKPTEWKAVDLPKSAAVADAAGDTPTAEEFNALLAALRSAGLMAAE